MTEHDEQNRAGDPGSPGLEPAHYDPTEGHRAFAPNRKWGLFFLGVAAVAGFFGAQVYGKMRARDEFRAGLLQRYDDEARGESERVAAYLDRLNGWIVDAARAGEEGEVPTFAREGFRWSEMHDRRGLYLRLEAEHATDPEAISEAARGMSRDAITRCLGVSPVSARGLYAISEFFAPAWVERVRAEDDHMRLRVIDEELGTRIARDLPLADSMMASDYFLLLVTRGGRIEGTVDAFVWDLQSGERLMTTRTRANGRLITVQLEGVRMAWPDDEALSASGAADCSIAAALKVAAGEEVGMPSSSRRPEVPDEAVATGEGVVGAAPGASRR